MNISSLFIKRPVMTTLLMTWLVMVSLYSYQKLSVNALPKLEFPVIVVTANLTGASAETMAQSVALPLEQQFSAIPGLSQITSTNAQENTQITLEFDLETNLNAAAQDVASAISGAQNRLPIAMTALPSFKKVNPAEQPIIVLALQSKTMPIWKLNQYADNVVIPRLSMLPNVAQVVSIGRQKYAVRIEVDPVLAHARGMGLAQIAKEVATANTNTAAGILQGDRQLYSIKPNSQLKNAAEFSEILLNNQHNLRLKDVATVTDDVANPYAAAWYNEDRGLMITIQRQPGTNSVELAQKVQDILPSIQQQIPNDIQLSVVVDRTISTKDGIREVKLTGIMTIALVVFVIFMFLRNGQATLIPSLSLPISILLTFMVMYFLDFSINNMTLLAMTLSTGFIIDDAIVVLENIMVFREKGLSAREAALQGSKEIAFTVISMTLSLVAVFIPIMLMPGIVGRFLYEFSMTIVISILASGFVSLSLIPMMSQYLSDESQETKNWCTQWFKNVYDWMELSYKKSLIHVFKFQKYIVPFLIAILFVNLFFFKIIAKGFFPNEDTGLIYGISEGLPEISFSKMKETEASLNKILLSNPNIESFNSSIGTSSSTIASNEGRFFVVLKEIGKRDQIETVLSQLRSAFTTIPNLRVSMQAVQNLRIGGSLSKSQYQYTLQSQNFNELAKYSTLLETRLRQEAGFLDINTDLKMNSLQAEVEIDRTVAARLGVSVQQISDAIGFGYSDSQVSTIYSDLDTYGVVLSYKKSVTKKMQDLEKLYVTNAKGVQIPLSAFATFKRRNAPLTINHLNRLPSVSLSFNLAPGKSLGQAMLDIKRIEQEIHLPGTTMTSFQGLAKAFQSSKGGQFAIIMGSILTIYIILGILYENYRHPITILSGLPSAGLGALFFLMLFKYELDVIALIGIILLIGIVKKNAIMMIDYALTLQKEEGFAPKEAIIAACHRRFRPIMMTTFAAIMGALPIAVWNGSGAEFRKPLGVCIIGGLLVSQWLTLYITPLFYVWIENFRKKPSTQVDVTAQC